MIEFCKFILTLGVYEWLKIMGTFAVLGVLLGGIVGEIGAKWPIRNDTST